MSFNQTQKQQLITANLALKSLVKKKKKCMEACFIEIVISYLIIIQSSVNVLNQIKLTDF